VARPKKAVRRVKRTIYLLPSTDAALSAAASELGLGLGQYAGRVLDVMASNDADAATAAAAAAAGGRR
jgi:hypothetical protein